MTTATDFAKQLSRFLSEYLPHERNVSPNTLFAYRDAFVQYIDYMHTRQGVAVEKLCLKHLTRQCLGVSQLDTRRETLFSGYSEL